MIYMEGRHSGQPLFPLNGKKAPPTPRNMAGQIMVILLVFSILIVLNIYTDTYEEDSAMSDIIHIEEDNIPIVRAVYILSLIAFGILDSTFAYMLWKAKPPFENEKILSPLFRVYQFNRVISMVVLVGLGYVVIHSSSPQPLNTFLLVLPVFIGISLMIIVIIKTKVLTKPMKTNVTDKPPEDTSST